MMCILHSYWFVSKSTHHNSTVMFNEGHKILPNEGHKILPNEVVFVANLSFRWQ